MSRDTKKILLYRELHETVIIRSRLTFRFLCEGCQAESEFLTLDEAVNLFSVGTREILRRLETGEVHALDMPNGQMLVCAKLLAR